MQANIVRQINRPRRRRDDRNPTNTAISPKRISFYQLCKYIQKNPQVLKRRSTDNQPTLDELKDMMQSMQQDVDKLKNDMHVLLRKLDDKWWDGFGEPEELVEMPKEEIKKLILDKIGRGKIFYPSDIAMDYNLDYDAVLEAVKDLRHEHHIED